MKLDCDARRKRKLQWLAWFAWYPVRLGDGDCRWMEMVERQGFEWCAAPGDVWFYRYRALR